MDELRKVLNEVSEEISVVVMPDFFFDRLITLKLTLTEFVMAIGNVAKRKGGGEDIKVDNKLRIYPKFYRGQKGRNAFPEYSMVDVLDGKVSRNLLRGKTILIGVTAPQHALPQMTPIGQTMAPVRVIAHKVSSLLNNELYAVPS